MDFQDGKIVPHRATSFTELIRMGEEVFHALKKLLKGARTIHRCGRRGRRRTGPAQQRAGYRIDRGSDHGGRLSPLQRHFTGPGPSCHPAWTPPPASRFALDQPSRTRTVASGDFRSKAALSYRRYIALIALPPPSFFGANRPRKHPFLLSGSGHSRGKAQPSAMICRTATRQAQPRR